MLFNSLEFLIFLPTVWGIYWLLGGHNIRAQNLFILLASYFFYACWDWRFLSLLGLSTLVDYFIGISLYKAKSQKLRKYLLITSLFVNLGILGAFKYLNFFYESFQEAFTFFGYPISDPVLFSIILPVGISFYTFQTLSYNIDIYKNKLVPTRDLIAFSSFVSFFPQLVAGPI